MRMVTKKVLQAVGVAMNLEKGASENVRYNQCTVVLAFKYGGTPESNALLPWCACADVFALQWRRRVPTTDGIKFEWIFMYFVEFLLLILIGSLAAPLKSGQLSHLFAWYWLCYVIQILDIEGSARGHCGGFYFFGAALLHEENLLWICCKGGLMVWKPRIFMLIRVGLHLPAVFYWCQPVVRYIIHADQLLFCFPLPSDHHKEAIAEAVASGNNLQATWVDVIPCNLAPNPSEDIFPTLFSKMTQPMAPVASKFNSKASDQGMLPPYSGDGSSPHMPEESIAISLADASEGAPSVASESSISPHYDDKRDIILHLECLSDDKTKRLTAAVQMMTLLGVAVRELYDLFLMLP
jgi:hypothetical protein